MTSFPPPGDDATPGEPQADAAAPADPPLGPDPAPDDPPLWPDPAPDDPPLWPDPAQPPGEPQPPREGTPTAFAPTGSSAWTPWSAPLALIAWFGVTLVLTVVIALVASVMGAPLDDPTPGVNIAGTFAQDLVMIGAALGFALHGVATARVRLRARCPRPWARRSAR